MNNLPLHISTEETLALQIVLNNEYALGVSIDTITERKGPVQRERTVIRKTMLFVELRFMLVSLIHT